MDNLQQVKKQLLRVYAFLNSLTILVIVILYLLENKLKYPYTIDNQKFWQVVLAVISVVAGAVVPIWLRLLSFSRFIKAKRNGTYKDLYNFEKTVIIFSWIAFSLSPLAYVLKINLWVRYLVVFLGFYALYYSFPSDKKLKLDKKLFNLRSDGNFK